MIAINTESSVVVLLLLCCYSASVSSSEVCFKRQKKTAHCFISFVSICVYVLENKDICFFPLDNIVTEKGPFVLQLDMRGIYCHCVTMVQFPCHQSTDSASEEERCVL